MEDKHLLKCKKEFCHNKVTIPFMAYCSRECAPYGFLGMSEGWIRNARANQQRQQMVPKPKGVKRKRKAVLSIT